MTTVKAACIQVNASDDMTQNIEMASQMIRRAKSEGAEFITLPENVSMMEFGGENIIAKAYPEDEHPALREFKNLAGRIKAYLLIGSLAVSCEDDKVANRSYLISREGHIAASYDKIHLFDVDLPGGESYRESNTFKGGSKAVLAPSPWGKIGLSVCYDLRFPHLYRRLAQAGARILTVPAAFTKQTGQVHWEILLRARAIETGCYVIAPAQCGSHKGGRETYGHSLIIDPWGKILAEGDTEPGIIMADLDLDAVAETRQKIPSLSHDRMFEMS